MICSDKDGLRAGRDLEDEGVIRILRVNRRGFTLRP